MLEYQNLFTRVQIRTAPDPGLPIDETFGQRYGTGTFNYWAGKIGDSQIGPIYLGFWGIVSLLCGFLAFEIIGLNMMKSVGWSPSSSSGSCRGWRSNRRRRNTACASRR